MSDQRNRHGRREAGTRGIGLGQYWTRYRRWLAGLTRGQRIRYRLLQTATVISLIIIVAFLSLRAWIRVPTLPDVRPPDQSQGPDASGDLSFDGAVVPGIAESGRKKGVYTFLLVGKDTAGGGNTDTMLLLTYDTKEKNIQGLNLPRDTMLNVSTASKRLNAVYNYNKGKDKASQVEKGMAALKKEVSHLTGITPDFYVIVEWEAIGELVDALGGVEFEVPFDMDYDDPTPGQDLHIHQKAGLRLLSGDDAMQVIRHRKNNDGSHSNGDVGRLKIQQDFLKAVAKKCLQPATFLKIPELAKIFSQNVTTDLAMGNILAFAQLAYGMNPEEDVSFQTAPIAASCMYRGASMVTLDEGGMLKILNAGMNPYLRDIQASDLQLVYRKSNGSFGVTNATLADERMGQVPVSKPEPETEEPEVPEEPEENESGVQGGDASQGGDSSSQGGQGGDTSQGGSGGTMSPPDGSQGASGEEGQTGGEIPSGVIDPSEVFPDPNTSVSQDITRDEGEGNTVAVLPSRPEPIDQAA